MKKKEGPSSGAAALRRRAEKLLAAKADESGFTGNNGDTPRLVHELQVHQIELELQNEELRRARHELEASLERYTSLYDFAPVSYLTLDGRGVIAEINLAGAAELGSVRSQALGRKFELFLNPAGRGVFHDFLERVSRNETKQDCEVTLNIPGRGPRHVHIEGAADGLPEKGKGREGENLVRLTMLDITERRKTEEERVRLEYQLRQTQKIEAIGTLAGGIAHDFNNILTAIMGYAEMARDDILGGGANVQDLEEIINSAIRARDLVRQILTFSRKTITLFTPLDLNRKVDGVVKMLARIMPKDIVLETRLAANQPTINGDAGQLEQLLMNLATNARDAMPKGGRMVIETASVDLGEDFCRQYVEMPRGSYVLLRVSDTGQGIDPETLEHIFDPFFTTKEVGKGTGLGLSTAHGIVKAHGGQIVCDSTPGQGTNFDIFFPVPLGDAVVLEPPEACPRTGGTKSGGGIILLVDDEVPLLNVGSRTLSGAGYLVITAASGEQALALYRRRWRDLDLVVMDLGMPGMGGAECLKAMLEVNPRARILVASGYGIESRGREVLDAGASGYLAKPFKQADLLNTVGVALGKEKT